MVTCTKCDYTYSPGIVPGGQCPRCLLLGMHEDDMDVPPDDTTDVSTNTKGKSAKAHDLEIDEVAAELPGFELEEQIGRGGMGVVWRARERLLDRHVAIKLLRNVDNDPSFVERFTREARVMARLNHPNVVTLYSFGRTRSNHCYMVMELIEGMDLAHAMAKKKIDVPRALAIVSDVCDALEVAHRAGFVHRDMKPGNVLLDNDGHVKVGDFGLARLARPLDPLTLSITKHGHAVGTPQYIAPEQARGRGNEDHRADIYSMGVMLYEMLTGELPRGIFKPPSQKLGITKLIDKVILNALQEDANQRYQSITTLKEDVWKIRKQVDPQLIAQTQAARHDSRWRHRSEMLLATAVSGLLGIICAWYAREWMEPPPAVLNRPYSTVGMTSVSNSLANSEPTKFSGISTRPMRPLAIGGGLQIVNEVRLQPSDLSPGARFGQQVVTWDAWLATSAYAQVEGRSVAHGAIYLYRRADDGHWQFVQRLLPPRPADAISFGTSLAMDAGHLVICSSPQQRRGEAVLDVYQLSADQQSWLPQGGESLQPKDGNRLIGQFVALKGLQVVTFGLSPSNQRCLIVFNRDVDGKWRSDALFPDNGLLTGRCHLASDGSIYAGLTGVAEETDDGSFCGGLFIAQPQESNWRIKTLVRPLDPTIAANSFFSVTARQDRVLLGAYRAANQEGLGWIVRRTADDRYESEGYLTAPYGSNMTEFGKSVALGEGWLAISADHQRVDSKHRGAVHFYSQDSTPQRWTLHSSLLAEAAVGANDFGNSIAVQGSQYIAIGAPRSYSLGHEPRNEDEAPGAVFVYELQ